MPPVFEPGKPLTFHDSYGGRHKARDFWNRSFWTGPSFIEGEDALGNPILPQHERETAAGFARRKSQAIARRYPKYVINRYNDHANRMGAVRQNKSAGPYADLILDATFS